MTSLVGKIAIKLPILEPNPLGVMGDTTFKAQEPFGVDKA
jgi:hypothetical protein